MNPFDQYGRMEFVMERGVPLRLIRLLDWAALGGPIQ
jgi:hypothetical protein